MGVGCVECEDDFVDRDAEAVGLCVLLPGCGDLRNCATCVGKDRESEQAADDLMQCGHVL